MRNDNKSTIIQVSFKEEEMELYHNIILRCKLLGKSGWMKEAAMEKLAREESGQTNNTMQVCNIPFEQNTNMIDSLLDSII